MMISLLAIPQDPTPEQPASGPQAAEKLQDIGEQTVGRLPDFLVGLVVLAAFLVIAWLIRRGVGWYTGEQHRRHRNLALALGRLASGITIVVGLLVAAVVAFENFTPTKLIEILGLGSVAVGFAFRDVLQNYLAGILLLITQPFRIGDQIVFKDYEGTVEEIETRATFVRTYDGRRVVIPNGELFTNSVLVNTAFEHRRLEYDIGIGYEEAIPRVKDLVREALRECGSVLSEPRPEVLTYDLADSAIKLRVRWWMEPPLRRDVLESRDEVLAAIKQKLLEAGVDLPFPTTQIVVQDVIAREPDRGPVTPA